MPIEIRELVIRTQIIDDGSKKTTLKQVPINEREIIERCVEKILKKVYKKTER